MRWASAIFGDSDNTAAPVAASQAPRRNTRCSGVAKRSEISPPGLGRVTAVGRCPPAAGKDVHGRPPNRRPLETLAAHHGQVTAVAGPSDRVAAIKREPGWAKTRSLSIAVKRGHFHARAGQSQ